jgi:hypothetical protein
MPVIYKDVDYDKMMHETNYGRNGIVPIGFQKGTRKSQIFVILGIRAI